MVSNSEHHLTRSAHRSGACSVPPAMQAEHFVREGPRGQTGRDIPRDILARALQRLLRTALAQGGAELDACRKTIAHAFRWSGRVLADIGPELEQFIGPQTPEPELPLGEAEMGNFCPASVRQATPITGGLP